MALSLGDEIATYLQAQSLTPTLNFNGAGTINLFVSVMPDTPDVAVAVFERGGLGPLMTLTGTGAAESKFERATIQVMIRTDMNGYVAGNTLAQAIYGKLQGIVETKINGNTNQLFHLINAVHPPAYLQRDSKQRHMWSQNFYCWYENGGR